MDVTVEYSYAVRLHFILLNGTIGNDKGNALAVDSEGNVYAAATSDVSNGSTDILLLKYSPEGDTLWTRRYNGSANGEDESNAIALDAVGNIYVVGRTSTSNSGFGILTLKYNSSGQKLWAAVFNGMTNVDEIGYKLHVDQFENVP